MNDIPKNVGSAKIAAKQRRRAASGIAMTGDGRHTGGTVQLWIHHDETSVGNARGQGQLHRGVANAVTFPGPARTLTCRLGQSASVSFTPTFHSPAIAMFTLKNFVAGSFLALSIPALAVVIRHDVPDLKYRIQDSQVRAIANLPHEGHGVLIEPQWILTAAHAIQWNPHRVTEIMLNGACRKVEHVIVHNGYKTLPKELTAVDADVAPALTVLAASDDIALIKLAEPVADVQPLKLYRGDAEVGKLMQVIGMGASGNGERGQDPHSSHRTALRRAFNVVGTADARWLGYVFDSGPGAHPLEGMSGNGDSGGPVLIEDDGEWKLAGLTSWTSAEGKVGAWKPGRYGTTSFAVRVSRYLPWINQTLATNHSPAVPDSKK